MASDEQAKRFYELFKGNPTAHYTRPLDGPPSAVRRGIGLGDVHRHLNGRPPSLLSVPTDVTGTSHFGCIDLDAHGDAPPIDHAALARQVTALDLPLVVCRSTRGRGAWLFLFVKEPEGFFSADVRQHLEYCAARLSISGAEVFPKQDFVRVGGVGSGVNLPYFGARRHAFGADGEELTLDQFLDFAEERKVSGQFFENARIPFEIAPRTRFQLPQHVKCGPKSRPGRDLSDSKPLLPWRTEAKFAEWLVVASCAAKGHRHEALRNAASIAAQACRAGILKESTARARWRKVARAIYTQSEFSDDQLEEKLTGCWIWGLQSGNLDFITPAEVQAFRTIEEPRFHRAFDGDVSDFASASTAKAYVVQRLHAAGVPDPERWLLIGNGALADAIAREQLHEILHQEIERLAREATP